ncbi:MAG: hypothetical protein LBH20_01275, partial [Treponema sp.]|nr:hypothetical protein [Treponema sp.]
MKQSYTRVCAVAVMVCMTACAGQNVNPSISAIFSAWLKLRAEILNTNLPESGFDGKIEDFRRSLNLFSSSPIGSIYTIQRPEHLQYLADIDAAAQRLSEQQMSA